MKRRIFSFSFLVFIQVSVIFNRNAVTRNNSSTALSFLPFVRSPPDSISSHYYPQLSVDSLNELNDDIDPPEVSRGWMTPRGVTEIELSGYCNDSYDDSFPSFLPPSSFSSSQSPDQLSYSSFIRFSCAACSRCLSGSCFATLYDFSAAFGFEMASGLASDSGVGFCETCQQFTFNICNKTFRNWTSKFLCILRSHKRLHTGELQSECHACVYVCYEFTKSFSFLQYTIVHKCAISNTTSMLLLHKCIHTVD